MSVAVRRLNRRFQCRVDGVRYYFHKIDPVTLRCVRCGAVAKAK